MTAIQLAGRLFCLVPEAAQVLELDPRTLRRAIEAGEFPAVKISGSWRIPVAKLLELAGLTASDVEANPSDVLRSQAGVRNDESEPATGSPIVTVPPQAKELAHEHTG